MKLGVFSALFGNKSWEEACKSAKEYGVGAIEVGGGGFVGKNHLNPREVLKDKAKIMKFKDIADKNGLEISAISVHGNPIHPDPDVSKEHSDDIRAAIELAPQLGVKVVNGFAGCPGAGGGC
jgi:sugar phosphate isomerase/epimerase